MIKHFNPSSAHAAAVCLAWFDCTAPSLHVGSLMQIMCLRLLQKYGHQPIVLLGGGTWLSCCSNLYSGSKNGIIKPDQGILKPTTIYFVPLQSSSEEEEAPHLIFWWESCIRWSEHLQLHATHHHQTPSSSSSRSPSSVSSDLLVLVILAVLSSDGLFACNRQDSQDYQ